MLITTICPKCGGQMEVDDSRERVFCTYCGTEIINISEKVEVDKNINVSGTVTHVIDRSSEPNLHIYYQSSNVGVQMIVRVISTGKKYTFLNGHHVELYLPEGTHQIVFKIGKINYNRTITITNGSPVTVYATWNGHADISIEQPDSLQYVSYDSNTVQGKITTLKPWYTRWWIWVLLVIVMLFLIGIISQCSGKKTNNTNSAKTNAQNNSSTLSPINTGSETSPREKGAFREYEFTLPSTWHIQEQANDHCVISLGNSQDGILNINFYELNAFSLDNDSDRVETVQIFVYEEGLEEYDDYWISSGITAYVCAGNSNDEYGSYKIGVFTDSYHGLVTMKMYISEDENVCIDEFNEFLNSFTINKEQLSKYKKETLDSLSTYYEIGTGYYTAGVDLPIGKMNITVISGRGTVHTDNSRNGGLNEMMGISDSQYYITSFNGVTMDANVVLDVSGTLILAIEYTNIDGEYTGRKYDDTNAFSLTAGNYVAGKDFPPGTYNISAVSGRGTISSSNMFRGGVNEMFGIDNGMGYYTEQIVNVDFPEGTSFEISGIEELRMTPAH